MGVVHSVSFGYERVHKQVCKLVDIPFYIQDDDEGLLKMAAEYCCASAGESCTSGMTPSDCYIQVDKPPPGDCAKFQSAIQYKAY